LAKGFYKRISKKLKKWEKFFKKIAKSFLQKIGKRLLQKNWKKTFYKDLGKNFFTKKLAKLLKQKHTNNFFKTFFTKLF
jgi:hypothetical protein